MGNPVLKKILLKSQNQELAKAFEDSLKISPIAARVLAARGFSVDEIPLFLQPSLKTGIPDPKLLVGLSEGCQRLAQAVKKKETVAIACDFDVDGLTGGSQLYDFLQRLQVDVHIFIPNRFTEGYGLNIGMVEKAAAVGAKVLVTIDFGTTNEKELLRAKELGIFTIVIDHHHVGDLKSPSDVFINPNQQGCGFGNNVLSASGLTWFFLIGLRQVIPEAQSIDIRSFLDLAALGTICDMVPLIGINRVIAKRGLEVLSITERRGIKSLKALAGVKNPVSCYDVGFGLGPRINAAGRIVHGEVVIELLTTQDPGRADSIAHELHKLNGERQEIEAQMKDIAVKRVETYRTVPHGIVVAEPEFHTGVIGIVAQRLVEAFYRPSAVLGVDTPGIFKGSVRGIKGFSVVGALASCSEHLIKFGGHEGAGGFSVSEKNLQKFKIAWDEECRKRLATIETTPAIEADTEASLEHIGEKLIRELETFSPFGLGNPAPQLLFKKMKVLEIKTIKSAHTKVILTDGRGTIPGLMWKTVNHPFLHPGAFVNVIARPDINSYNGMSDLQLTLSAVEKA